MQRLLMVMCLLLTTQSASEAWAKRAGPQPVPPVVSNGVRYTAPNATGREGRIEARSEKTGEKLWDVVIYTITIDVNLEEDVQWVFITGMAVRDNTLLVTNEKNEHFTLDLKTKVVHKDDPKKP